MRSVNVFGLLIILLTLVLPVAAVNAKEDIELSWALLRDTDEGLRSLDFTTVPVIPKGTTLQLYLHPGEHTYTYVFLVDSSNHVVPIFPSTLSYYDDNSPGDKIRIPAGQDRFTIVPPPGEERFYILASGDRFDDLERYLEECLIKPGNTDIQAKLYREIRVLRRRHSTLTQVTEKGMPVSGSARQLGQTRSAAAKEDFHVTHVTAEGFYSKILRLNHD